MDRRPFALALVALAFGCAAPPPPLAPRLTEPSGLERVWIEAFGLE